MKQVVLGILSIFLVTSCVSKKKFTDLMSEKDKLMQSIENCKKELAETTKLLSDCNDEKAKLMNDLNAKGVELGNSAKQLKGLEDQIASLKANNSNLLRRLEDLSVISKAGSETIKKSLDALNEKEKTIKDLTSELARKEAMSQSIASNLKKSLAGTPSEDIQVVVKQGVVHISLSDKMLFGSASAKINKASEETLSKVAKVVNDFKDFDILVEGHTDNVPAGKSGNWDLSAKRATAVVKMLQTKYAVAPARMTAGGKSEYSPKQDNTTADGKKVNRRTEIILTPKLDQFLQLAAPIK